MKRVLDFFLPREKRFYDLLLKASENSLLAARKLRELMAEFASLNEQQRALLSDKIHEIENRGDEINHRINHELYNTFITPIDREDIHELANLLDDQTDLIDSLGKKIVYYNLGAIEPLMLQQMDLAISQLEHLHTAIAHMDNGSSMEAEREKVIALEDEADVVHRKAISALFADSKPPVEIIKLKDVYETLEILTDKNQRVAVTLESIVIKHA